VGTGSIRVGIVGRTGAGNYGHQLDEGFARHPRCHVVAVADPDDAGRDAARRRTGAERAYASYRELLEREYPHLLA
jgi:predicted dehydrogenase